MATGTRNIGAHLLGGDDSTLSRIQRTFRLPSPPRCQLCEAPFTGPYAPILRLFGFKRWELNQQMCRFCVRSLEKHSGEAEVSLLYVDVRGSTEMAEQMDPWAFSDGDSSLLRSGEPRSRQGARGHRSHGRRRGEGDVDSWLCRHRAPGGRLRAAERIAGDISAAVARGDDFPARSRRPHGRGLRRRGRRNRLAGLHCGR